MTNFDGFWPSLKKGGPPTTWATSTGKTVGTQTNIGNRPRASTMPSLQHLTTQLGIVKPPSAAQFISMIEPESIIRSNRLAMQPVTGI